MKKPHKKFERKLSQEGYSRICGIDEAGRGCWAGPLVGAGVVINTDTRIFHVNDSKKLRAEMRKKLSEKIKEKAVAYSIIEISVEEIDRMGVGEANAELIRRIINELNPDYALIDKAWVRYISIPYETIVKGDAKVFSIAAASILAKVHRDEIMEKLDKEFPKYNFAQHKGYGTRMHEKILNELGRTPIHRKSFKPVSQPKLFT